MLFDQGLAKTAPVFQFGVFIRFVANGVWSGPKRSQKSNPANKTSQAKIVIVIISVPQEAFTGVLVDALLFSIDVSCCTIAEEV